MVVAVMTMAVFVIVVVMMMFVLVFNSCAPPAQGAHMKTTVRSFVFGPEKGGWKEGKENLTQQRIKGA